MGAHVGPGVAFGVKSKNSVKLGAFLGQGFHTYLVIRLLQQDNHGHLCYQATSYCSL